MSKHKLFDARPVFEELKALLSHYAGDLEVVRDDEENYYLDTRYVMKNGKNLFFGAVQTRKKYVSYHLMPVYVTPALMDAASEQLRRRMHGKSCFNFTKLDTDMIQELSAVTEAGFRSYIEAGYIQTGKVPG